MTAAIFFLFVGFGMAFAASVLAFGPAALAVPAVALTFGGLGAAMTSARR